MSQARELLKILACPLCKGPLSYREKPEAYRCDRCSRDYPIQDGIPDFTC